MECLGYYVKTYFNEVNQLPAEQQIYPVHLAVRCTKIKYHLLSLDPMARILMKQAILRRRLTAYDQRQDVLVYEESKPASAVYRRHDKDPDCTKGIHEQPHHWMLSMTHFDDLSNIDEIKRFVENETPFSWSDALIAEATRVDRTRLPRRFGQRFLEKREIAGVPFLHLGSK
ncbi:hypothetical protein QOT17_000941 [Balamuthia mandrillaris]